MNTRHSSVSSPLLRKTALSLAVALGAALTAGCAGMPTGMPDLSAMSGLASAASAAGESTASGGQELPGGVEELSAKQLFDSSAGMKNYFKVARFATAMQSNAAGGAMESLGGLMSGDVTGAALSAALAVAKSYFTNQALEQLVSTLAADQNIMESTKVSVPLISNANPEIRTRVLDTAKYIALLRASNTVMANAQKELETAGEKYKEAIGDMQEAGDALGELFRDKQGTSYYSAEVWSRNGYALTPGQQELLAQFEGRTFQEVMQDAKAREAIFDIQLRNRPNDPKIAEFRAALNQMNQHVTAYKRAGAGGIAVIGVTILAFKEAKDFVQRTGTQGAAMLTPMLKELPGDIINSAKVAKSMLASSFDGDEYRGTFAIVRGGVYSEELDGKKVYSLLTDAEKQALKANLVGSDTALLQQVAQQNPAFIGQYTDRFIKEERRSAIAQAAGWTPPMVETPPAAEAKTGLMSGMGSLLNKAPDPYEGFKFEPIFSEQKDSPLAQQIRKNLFRLPDAAEPYLAARQDLQAGIEEVDSNDLRKLIWGQNRQTISIADTGTAEEAGKGRKGKTKGKSGPKSYEALPEFLVAGEARIAIVKPGFEGILDKYNSLLSTVSNVKEDTKSGKADKPKSKPKAKTGSGV